MKKVIPVLILIGLILAGCSLFTKSSGEQPLTDAEMATRVADLLATMTTPTFEIVFPPTPTAGLPTVNATQETPVVVTTQPAGGDPLVTVSPEVTVTTPAPIEATSTPQPTATATVPPGDPINTLGSPSSTDPMDSNQKWAWPTGADDFVKVEFKDGYMNMTGLTNYAGWRLPLVSQQIDTYIELTANSGECTGKDSYGIIFRVPVFREPEQGYLFEVTCDGYYRLWKWDGKVKPNGLANSLVNWKQSSAIVAGANQTNRLGVMVVDDTFKLYINGVAQEQAVDTSYAAGFFGTFVRAAGTSNYTVKFDAMKFWENPAQ